MRGAWRVVAAVAASLLAVPIVATAVVAAPGDDTDPTTTTIASADPTPPPAPTTTAPDATTAPEPETSTTAPDTASSTTVATSTTSQPSPVLAPGDDPITTTPAVTTTEPPFVILLTPDPTNTIAIDKTNTADGEPAGDGTTAQPGDSFTYNLLASCSNINVDCVNLTVVDTFPADVVVDETSFTTTCADVVGLRDVTYDSATRTVTIVYVQPLANPPGALGKLAGTSDNCSVRVTLPADTPLEDGAVIPNEATISADNVAESATDPSDVIVDVPRTVGVQTTKNFTDPSAIAGDPAATTTVQLGSVNQSSNSAEVTNLTIEDSTAAMYEYLDVTAVRVTQYPAGAVQAELLVCPEPGPCTDDTDWVAGGTAAPPAPSTLAVPATVAADEVVGVRVVFTADDGSFIENAAGGGAAAVEVDMALRDTVRSTDQPIVEIPATTTIDNTATSTVTDLGASPTTATDDATAQYQILPPTLSITPSKTFFPDGNGNYRTDAGEHAVIGENSGVSMIVNATNASAFPISEIVITEPATSTTVSEFDKFDPDSIRLTFPAGAASANVVVTYEGGGSTTNDYPAPGPGDVALHPPDAKVTSITVTYTGDPAVDGGNTIQPGATAGLGVHGNLNDLVDESDVPGGGTVAGIDNCADVDAVGTPYAGGTGTAAGTACAQLPIEARDAGTGGTKVPSQGTVPADQAVLFTMTTTNNGNLPLIDLVVADPPTDAAGNPPTPDVNSVWYWGQFLGADVQPAAMAGRVTIEIYSVAGGWQPLPLDSPPERVNAAFPDVIGVRASIDVLNPTESFSLRVGMVSRAPLPDGDVPPTLINCYGVTADTANGDGEYDAETYCSPPIFPGPITESAAINKAISPETLPKRIPGMTPQNATVTLQIRNTGTILARTLQITDNDAGDTQPADFWDAVDFVGISSVQAPAVGALRDANQLQIDAYVDADGAGPGIGSWVAGTPTAIGSPSVPVPAAQVRGLRFTFSDTSTLNDGYVLTPCDGADVSCAGIVEFQVRPRLTLVSTGAPIPDVDPCPDPDVSDTVCSPLLDSATGAFTTRLHPDPDDPATIDEVTDDLFFVPGTPSLDVAKSPENATVQPGQLATFNLVTTNDGTANLPDVTVSDPLPNGILFDGSYADPETELPYTVTWTNLPDDYDPPPAPTFETTADPTDPTRVGLLRWTFADWEMPPNASVSISYRYTLEPGVLAGQQITNTMGASSPVADLECSDPNDGVVIDGDFGDGTYCTDPANVTVTAGASFASRKWVAGTHALGWYNVLTGAGVPVGDPACLSLEANERTYTTNPCIALVNPGEPFHYVLRVQNAGTESALEMTIVDKFPAPGDTGVAGADRGTEWATAPTLAGPATYAGPPTGTIQYTTGEACAAGLSAWPCDDVTWTGAAAPGSTGLRLLADFAPDPLPPGGTVDVSFTMTTPIDVPQVSDPTIAWNSIAHSEVTDVGNGSTRPLAPLEPLKVGVATMYGTLQVVKAIRDNPAGLPLDDVEFEFTYECTTAADMPWPAGGPGSVTATPTTPGIVTGIPAGSSCEVTETGTNGGIPDPESTTVVIEPSTDPDTPVETTVTFTNDFPLGEIDVLKDVTGFAIPGFTSGPYPITVDCRFLGTTVPGFPQDAALLWVGAVPLPIMIEAPVGSVCTVVETGDNGATTVTYDPANADGTAAEVTVPSEAGATVEVTITNDFPIGAVALLKTVSGGVDPVFTPGPYVAELTCTFNDLTVPGFPVEIDLDPGLPSDPVAAPVGSLCTVTETDDRGATTVTFDPASPDGTAGQVTVPVDSSDAEPITITITNDFPVGGLQVTKTIGVNDADLDLDDVVYGFHYECTFDPDGDGPDAPITVEGDLEASVNDPAEVDGLPAGAECTVTETETNGAVVPIDPETGDPMVPETTVTIVAGTILRPYTPAPFVNDYPTGRAELVKLVTGGAQDEFTGGPYTIAVDCVAVGQTESFPGFPVVVEVVPNEPVGTELPVGTTCVFEELDVPDGVEVTYEPPNPDGPGGLAVVPPVEPPPDEEPIATVSVTNTFTTGSLVITKAVSGPGAPAFSQGPFVFDVTCDDQGVEDVYSVAVVVPGSPDGTPVQSDPVTGLPIGAVCTVTEIDNGGADIVTPPQTVTIEQNEQANVAFVGVNNPFSAGTISVVKRVDGSAASSAYALRFTVRVQCAVAGTGGDLVTVLDRTVTVAGDGVAVPVTDGAGNPALAPLGARCWGSETNPAGATRVVVDHDSYADGVEVVASGELQLLQITVTNTFDATDPGVLPWTGRAGTRIVLGTAVLLVVAGVALLAALRVRRRA